MSDKEAKTTEVDFYDEMSGAGYDNMGGDKFVMPMLLVAQKSSKIVEDGTVKLGDFYNSVTQESYGPSISVVPVYFESVWQIWKPDMGGFVGRVRPGSIKVTGDVYKGMKTKAEDGGPDNVVDDTWMYFVLIEGREAEGMLMLPVTSSGIKHTKNWNSFIHDTRTSSGKRAPLFYKYWKLTTHKNEFDKGTAWTFGEGSKTDIVAGKTVPREIYMECVKPALEIASSAVYGEGNIAIDAPAQQLQIASDTDSSSKY